MSKIACVVLKVVDSEEKGIMSSFHPQVATIQEYDSFEDAACCNVGSHPDAERRGRPYRSVVIPAEQWHEFTVYSNRVFGAHQFEAVISENPVMGRPTSD